MAINRCSIIGCGNGYSKKTAKKCRLFRPPFNNKKLLKRWREAIQKIKLTTDTRVCQEHFEDDCFVKGVYGPGPPDGKMQLYAEFKKWTLKDNSVPTLKIGRPENTVLRTYIPNQRAERYNKRMQPSLPDEETQASTSFEDVIQSVAADPSTSNCDETSMIGAESSSHSSDDLIQMKTEREFIHENLSELSQNSNSDFAAMLEVNIKEEPIDYDSEPQTAGEEVRQPPIDPKLVTIPKNWSWVNNSSGDELCCVNIVFDGNRVLNPKSIRIIGNLVVYNVWQNYAVPSHLAETFNSVQALNDIIKYFDAAAICEGCPEKDLMLLELDSAKIPAEGIRKSSRCWRSGSCEYVVVPGEHKCPSCVRLNKFLQKKKSQMENKKLKIKNRRTKTAKIA